MLFRSSRVAAVSGNARVGNRVNFVTHCQALEYICGYNLDRRAYTHWNCVTVVPGAISAFRSAAIAEAGGFSPQTLAEDARLFPHYSVRGNLLYGARRAKNRLESSRFDDVVELLDLGSLLARRPGSLSGGEKQRVALGRALLARPRLLLLDEPLSSLDAARRDEVLPCLERLRDHCAIPMVLEIGRAHV